MSRLHFQRDDHQQDCTWYHLASPRGDLVAKRCSSLSTRRSSPSSCPSPPLLKLFVHCCCNYHLCYLNHHLIISQLPDHLGHLVHLHLTGFCLSCEFIVVWINQHRRPHRLPPHHHQFSSFFWKKPALFRSPGVPPARCSWPRASPWTGSSPPSTFEPALCTCHAHLQHNTHYDEDYESNDDDSTLMMMRGLSDDESVHD